MNRSTPFMMILGIAALLSACGGKHQSQAVSLPVVATSTIAASPSAGSSPAAAVSAAIAKAPSAAATPVTAASPVNAASPVQTAPSSAGFEPGLAIDFDSYRDGLDDSALIAALRANLDALVGHDEKGFRAGFVNEQLADGMMGLYGETYRYRFTGIEGTVLTSSYGEKLITVLGQRANTATGDVEDVKMMYVLKPNADGIWKINMID
ncbi:hypothetical protein [Gorillibacterium sp. sgz500922]|uniref:hypothetical protein n=1 Tax=Gorillibacterium sp. sgz500922 TaxID=3446694 RepID=UPI003F667228